MGTLMVDATKCKCDGICSAICPARLIEQKGTLPSHIEGALALCIDCYHCVAACPQGALTIGDVGAAACKPLQKGALPSPKDAEQFLRSRRSIRSYQSDLVSKEKIESLINIASHAPAGHNSRDLSWLVVHNPADVQRLAALVIDWTRDMLEKQPNLASLFHFDRLVKGWDMGIDPVCRKAPHLILVYSSQHSMMAPSAATIALAYLELIAHAEGLGTCWAGYFNIAVSSWAPLREALPIDKGKTCHGAMLLGYPQYRYQRLPPRPQPSIGYL